MKSRGIIKMFLTLSNMLRERCEYYRGYCGYREDALLEYTNNDRIRQDAVFCIHNWGYRVLFRYSRFMKGWRRVWKHGLRL